MQLPGLDRFPLWLSVFYQVIVLTSDLNNLVMLPHTNCSRQFVFRVLPALQHVFPAPSETKSQDCQCEWSTQAINPINKSRPGCWLFNGDALERELVAVLFDLPIDN